MQLRRIVIVFLAHALVVGAFAGNAEIPVPAPGEPERIAMLEAFVYKPNGPGPFPVLILNHGSAGGMPQESIAWKRDAAYWSQRGYLVVAPMRRGRGKSSGTSLESEDKNCKVSEWFNTLPQSLQDLDAVIEFAEKIPEAIAGAVTMIGVSRGGFLSVAYAAEGRHRSKVRSVVNLVGGWVAQAEDQCAQDFNAIAFERYGRQTRTPMLWLYGTGDLFYGDASVSEYADTFKKSGGIADFRLIEGVPENGHWLPRYPAKWRKLVDDFLHTTNAALPKPSPDVAAPFHGLR
ncbi:alpha/beta hydrolase family protein [Caenimonas terrae]|uniref:Alpha/beta hydrolase family protein n=1 Tax=Caenimonas terrae TaxID=696074 RepID=A0ABW0N936_9BURK